MLQDFHRLGFNRPSRATLSNCITLFALITQRWPVHSCSFPRHTPLTPALLCEMDTEYFPEAGAYFPTSERLEEPWGLLSHHYLTQTQTQRYMQAGLILTDVRWTKQKADVRLQRNHASFSQSARHESSLRLLILLGAEL